MMIIIMLVVRIMMMMVMMMMIIMNYNEHCAGDKRRFELAEMLTSAG